MEKEMFKAGCFIYPLPVVLVTCGNMEKSNILTVAWTGIINTKPATVYISVRPERYSYNIIKDTKEFVINLTNESLVKATDWCGMRSGSKYNKFKEMKLDKQKSNFLNCPMIKQSPVSIECKVKEIKKIGSHDMFIAEVLCVNAAKQYIDKNGKFDINKCNLITYANGNYYQLGRKIGNFGFSVAKKRKNIHRGPS